MQSFMQISRWGSILLVSFMVLACEPKVQEHGRSDLAVKAGNIFPNHSTEFDVTQLLGTPAAKSQFGERIWYYFGSRQESVAFFKPEVEDQEVLQISFENGVVKDVKYYDQSLAEEVEISRRVTPTSGQSYGFFEQLLGNIGRFNKSQDGMQNRAGGGGSRVPGAG
jgi:hypothetical protein